MNDAAMWQQAREDADWLDDFGLDADHRDSVEARTRAQSILDALAVLEKRQTAMREALGRAVYVAEHLFQMVPRDVWRDSGGDDGQGHYEGDYHAEQTREELAALGALAAAGSPLTGRRDSGKTERLREAVLEAQAALAWRGNYDTELRCLDSWAFAKVRRVEEALKVVLTALAGEPAAPGADQ